MDPKPLSQLQDPHLSTDDLGSVFEKLVDASGEWYNIGLGLKQKSSILDNIKQSNHSNIHCMRDMLKEWLKSCNSPTWQALVDVLRNPTVREDQLARKLEQQLEVSNPSTVADISSGESTTPKRQTPQSFSIDGPAAPKRQTSQSFSSDGPATPTTSKRLTSNSSQSYTSGAVADISSDGPVTPERQISYQSFSSDGPATPTTPKRQTSDSSQSYTSGAVADISSDESTTPQRQTSDSSQANDNTEESVKQKPLPKPYGCGCGKCSLLRFLGGNCPSPTKTASKLPFLDTKGLSANKRDMLLTRLERESRDMTLSFQKLVSSTYESLCERNIPHSKLVTHLKCLGTLEPTYPLPGLGQTQPALLHDRFGEMEENQTIESIVSIISEYMSFFNYDIIEHIIEKLGTSDDQRELQKYKEKLENYCKRRVVECPPLYGNLSDPDGVCVVVKLDSILNKFTVKQLRHFKSELSTILRLTEYALNLVAVEEGCLQLTYRIPASVEHLVFPLSHKQKLDLQQAGVVQLSCGDYKPELEKPFREVTSKSTGRSKVDCINYKLKGSCLYGDRCRFLHEVRAERIYDGCVPVPEHIPMRIIVGKVLPLRSRTCIAEPLSESREIKVLADGVENLAAGMEKVRVGISQLIQLPSPTWSYFHPRGITENQLVQFREYTGRRPYSLQSQLTPYELYDCKTDNPPMSEGYEKPSHTLPLDSKAMLHKTLDATVIYRKEQKASVEKAVRNVSSSRKARVMTDCRTQIKQRIREALDWLQQNQKPNQGARLEGRFGKLVWIKLPQRVLSPEAAMGLEEFEKFVYDDPSHRTIFNTDVRSEVVTGLDSKLEIAGSIETFDLKLTTEFADHGGKKLDVRVKIKDEKLEVVAIKWNDTKLATFDLICLHRQHDTRLSLSYSEKIVPSTGALFDTVQRLLETITVQGTQTLQLIPRSEQWNVHLIRHKKRQTYVTDGKYMVTKTIVGDYEFHRDIAKDKIITVGPEDYKEHVEVEFHNILWECIFGRDLGITPEECLAVYMDKPTVPPGVKTLIPDHWDAETILQGVDEFLDKLDHLSEMLEET